VVESEEIDFAGRGLRFVMFITIQPQNPRSHPPFMFSLHCFVQTCLCVLSRDNLFFFRQKTNIVGYLRKGDSLPGNVEFFPQITPSEFCMS
jgi:hypothetical protein